MCGGSISRVVLFLVLSGMVVLGGVDSAGALSDGEYQKMLEESPDFAFADQALNRVWTRLPEAKKKALLKSQRAWLKQETRGPGKFQRPKAPHWPKRTR